MTTSEQFQIQPRDAHAAVDRIGQLLPDHLARLAALPHHGNRKLTVDQLLLALLLSFFEPMARSLRRIEDRGDFDGRLDLNRLARSTTADALAALDPQALAPVIADLQKRTPHLQRSDPSLAAITRRIIAADGTYLTTLADVAFALKHTKRNGRKQAQVRANVQLDVDSFTPQVISVSGDDGHSEPAAFASDLMRGVLYVMDRAFLDFGFLKQLLAKDNDFVLCLRKNAPKISVMKQLPLSAADAGAGVVSDQIVQLTGRNSPDGSFRLVTIHADDRNGERRVIRLLSNLIGDGNGGDGGDRGDDRGEGGVDGIAAHVIGSIYRLRWQIELFFKWFKTFARLDPLLSTSRNGITFQLYVAVIGVLMMVVQSGRRISIYALSVLSYVANGTMSLAEAMTVIEKRNREREMERMRQARKRAMKKLK